jgi:UDPglucose 6-dehydrogenase
MKIGIIGVGMVGGTISHGFQRIGHEVIEHDIKRNTTLFSVLCAPVVFVCVPTPSALDRSCDTTLVEQVIERLAEYNYDGLIVIKSTVTPGTTDNLQKRYPFLELAFCPEFLREKTAYTDFIDYHDVCIIGARNDADYQLVKEAHGRLPRRFAHVTPLEAEFCKYFSNVFNALRVVFANEFYDVCKAAGADYTKIKDAVTKRTNIPDYYLECNENLRAFGGNCLPKDTAAFKHYARNKGIYGSIFDYIVDANDVLKQSSEAKGKPE